MVSKGLKFIDGGSMVKYRGFEIEKINGNEFILRQPFLIQQTLTILNVSKDSYNKQDVLVSVPIPSKDEIGPERKHNWNYRTAICMLGYLQTSPYPDISMAVHLCVRFNLFPRLCH